MIIQSQLKEKAQFRKGKFMAKKAKKKDDKSLLGRNAIFTPDVINDIHIKSQLGRYRMRGCLLYTSPSPRDATLSRMPSSA